MATNTYNATPVTLLFEDEFKGKLLASPFRPLPIWFTSPDITDQNVDADALWTPESVSVSDGYLHLKAEKLSTPELGRHYSSGYVQTGGYFQDPSTPQKWFKYGYFEARIKAPAVAGTWLAFWLWADPSSSREIDIVEIVMKDPDTTYHTLHNDGEVFQVWKKYPDNLSHWHTYAVDWQPGLIVWYVDSVEAGRYEDTGNIYNQEMYLVLSYQLGGTWAGPVDDSLLPAEMLVDYVRVWSRKP
jgi:beta-glucanase (GH16 family)